MRIINTNEIKIGYWCARCCEHDLFQIKTQSDIDDIVEDIEDYDYDGLIPKIWYTKEDALKDLLYRKTED